MLVSLKDILKKANEGKYAVGLFNMLNLEMARGIIEAAEEEASPVILGVAEVHLPIIPFEYASIIMTHIARNASVPVCLHFDHGTDFDKIMAAADAGFSSVMYDGSALPYEENVRNTRRVCEAAHAKGVDVEAELGHVGTAGVDDSGDYESMYTEAEQVNKFIDATGVDALAVAIGTVHGQYRKTPHLDLNRLANIYKISKRPLVLHGGSGLSDDDFINTVKGGIRKVNICTEMCLAENRVYGEGFQSGRSFEANVVAAKDAVKEVVKNKIRLFGSSAKA
ncbi:MAG: class II fructose-bisphosphate aldolase [Clostridia bacterium]|nr:class II fructose-bisphosphate aldolase [Clostridia bacterium]